MNAGKRFDRIPTESFLPNVKYAKSNRLPVTLMYQNTRGRVGRPRALDTYICTNQRPANRVTPK